MKYLDHKVGDVVRLIKNESRFLKRFEVCQVIEAKDGTWRRKLRVQSFKPSYKDGLWWVWATKVEKCPEEYRRIVMPGDVISISGRNCLIIQIGKQYSVIALKLGLGLCPMRDYDHPLIADDLREELKDVQP